MKTYNVGIIGFGMIGKVHAFGYATLPYYAEPLDVEFHIAHVATAHLSTAQKAMLTCGADRASADFRNVTENPGIDIVHICTPNAEHLEPLLSAIQHGKHIYCDKPLTVSLAEAEQVRQALETSNYAGTNQMTFNLRFFPAIQRAKQMIAEGRLGKIYRFSLGYIHSSNASPLLPLKWKHLETGGAVRDLGSHLLDLADYLLGPFDTLIAETQFAVPKRPVLAGQPVLADVRSEDAFTILAKTPDGAHGILEGTKLATGNEDEMRLEINGEKGAVRCNLMDIHFLDYFDATVSDRPLGGESGWRQIPCGARFEKPETDFPSAKSTTGWVRAHAACLSNFLHAVAENRQVQPDLRQGIKIDQLLDKVFRSAQTRSWV
jgi:predicted dehydrogenase